MQEETLYQASDAAGKTKTERYADLTYGQKQKFSILSQFYVSMAAVFQLVSYITGKGENSLKSVLAKLKLLLKSSREVQRYHDALYDQFNIGEEYLFNDIIREVTGVRIDQDLDPFTSRIKVNCEQEFLNLFIVEDVRRDEPVTDKETGETKIRKTLVGYKPVFKLKSED